MKFTLLAPGADLSPVRGLILEHGWNTTCYQLLNPGIERWIREDGNALVGCVTRHGVRVVAGAPVCAADEVDAVVAAWEAQCRADGLIVCYFGAEARILAATQGHPHHATVVLGAQPVWSTSGWKQRFDGCATCRAQRNRARNKRLVVEEWSPVQAQSSPDIRRLLGEWLTTRGLPPMHFLVEPNTLGDLTGRRIFVGSIDGRPVGFLVLSPIPVRNGYLTEQFVRGFAAPNGTVESLLDYGVGELNKSGCEYVTMGIVPLSAHGTVTDNPPWLNGLLGWARAHGRRFYNFDGLDAFKSKFHPEAWEPIYAISNEGSFSFRSLYAIMAAFTDGPPPWTFLRAVGKAAWQEWRWLAGLDHRRVESGA